MQTSRLYDVDVAMGFLRPVVSYFDANVSEKHAVSIFRAEVTNLGKEGLCRIREIKAERKRPVREKKCGEKYWDR
jgi:hypothetical protein